MKHKEFSIATNWNYIGILTVIFVTLVLLILYAPWLRDTDSVILESVRRFLSPYPMNIALALSSFGFANIMLWPQITVVSVLISHSYYFKAILFSLCVTGSYYITEYIKNIICRERPYGAHYPGFSFPSCHAVLITTLCGILFYLVNHYVKNELVRIVLSILLVLWLILVVISRLWLGVHFLSDIIAGVVFGLIFVNIYIVIMKYTEN